MPLFDRFALIRKSPSASRNLQIVRVCKMSFEYLKRVHIQGTPLE